MNTIRCTFQPAPKPAPGRKVKPPPRPRRPRTDPARIARMLALAHHVERQIEHGAIPDYASAAAALGVTRARLSQVMSLLLLAPEIQAAIVLGELSASERDLRAIVSRPLWSEQQRTMSRDRVDPGKDPNPKPKGHND